ncbi:hypothetical protein OEZ86_012974 [Tetradesmus obliquus]|nr:hypothetical protein OEZ86_012974 [Tetradesmus obliquus]
MERRISVQAALCVVGCLHLITFASLLLQSPLLYGQYGLQPITGFFNEAGMQLLPPGSSYARNPSALLWSHPTLLVFHGLLGLSAEAAFVALCIAGSALGFAAACGAAHPLVFTALWLLYLSVASVGQAFLPQPGDAVLLEVTFACIWLSLSMLTDTQHQPVQQQEEVTQDDAEHLQQQREEAAAKDQQAAQQPAALLLRWLLFKLLLLTSSAKALTACVSARGLAECYSVLAAHGQPHSLTWLSQALPAPLAAACAAVAMLELPASFAVLLPGPAMQAPIALLLALQLVRAALGSHVLLHLAAAALCLAVLDDSWLAPVLQRVARCFSGSETAAGDADGARPGGLQRADSNCSLASIMSLEELQPAPAPVVQRKWDSPITRAVCGLVILVAALVLGNSGGTGHVLWLTAQQLTSVLGVLVPAAAGWWLFIWGSASWQAWSRASAASTAASAALQRKMQAAAEAAVRADAAAGMPAAGSAARAKPATANGLASPDPLLSPTTSPLPSAVKQLSAATPAAVKTTSAAAKHDVFVGPAAEGGAAASATDTEEDGCTPRAGRRKAAAKSAAQPRKGRMAKAAAPAGDAEGEGEAGTQEEAAATPARGAKRGTAARGRKAAAAPAGELTEDEREAAAAPAAAAAPTAPGAVAAVAATPATAAKTAASTPATAGKAVAARAASAAAAKVGLVERLAPNGPVVGAVCAVAFTLVVFLAGLPAVLAPAGWSGTTLRSVPALMDSYRFCRTWGVVSSSSSLQRSWAATSTAAASGVPGSYLAFELSTSDDGWAWQPVRFRQSGFAGMSAGQEGLLGRLRGVYEPRLQGRLAAAGSGSLEDDAWLLGLADKVLEGSPELRPYLLQPVTPHSWVKIDLVRYTPASVPAMRGTDHAAVPGGWLAQHVAEVLPVMPRGDPDWRETLAQLGMAAAAEAPRSVFADAAAHVTYPGWLLAALLAAVALRHCLLPGGLVYSLRAEGLSKAVL